MIRKFSLSAVALLSMTCISSLASADTLAPPGVYYGAGNSNSNWTVTNSPLPGNANLEIGLRAKPYNLGTDLVSVGNTYFAPIGAYSGDPLRPYWNWDFSVHTTYQLASYTSLLTITDNLGSTPKTFDPLSFIGDNATLTEGGLITGKQNSESPKFGSIFLSPYNMNTPAIYTFKLEVFGGGYSPGLLGSDTINVVVSADPVAAAAAVPVPAAASAGLSMLAALGIFGWVKRKLSA